MPSDQAPPIDFKGLPYGSNEDVNAVSDEELFGEPDEEPLPEGPDGEFLFSPSDRPGEPLTAGAPFGPGPDATRFTFEADSDLLDRFAERVAANPGSDPQAKAWAAKRAKGL